MKPEYAFKVAANLLRYKTKPRSVWSHNGPYTPQRLIPKATKAQVAAMERIMGPKNKVRQCRIGWVNVSQLRSTQGCLRHKNLLWCIANFDTMQKTFPSKDFDTAGVNLPIVCWSNGVPVIWNGNHRATAAMMLGKTKLRARIFRKYP